jgi:hypothetical protein
VSRLTGPDGVLPEALRLASRLAAGPTLAYAEAKRAIQAAALPAWATSWRPRPRHRPASGSPQTIATRSRRFSPSGPRSSTATDPASGRQSPCAHICG